MSVGDALRKNLEFWHWYPRLLCEGLTDEQLHWQPEDHPNHIMFILWHTYRSEDELLHGLLIGQPGVFTSEGWAERLPVAEPGNPPFGTGLTRDQIAGIRLRRDDLLEYTEAVRRAIQTYADGLGEEEASQQVPLPFFRDVYPMLESASRAEVLSFLLHRPHSGAPGRSSVHQGSNGDEGCAAVIERVGHGGWRLWTLPR